MAKLAQNSLQNKEKEEKKIRFPDVLGNLEAYLVELQQRIEALESKHNDVAQSYSVEPNDLVGIEEASKITGFKKGYIYELTHKKAIPFHKVSKRAIRFSRQELNEWMRAGCTHLQQLALDTLASNYIVNNTKPFKK